MSAPNTSHISNAPSTQGLNDFRGGIVGALLPITIFVGGMVVLGATQLLSSQSGGALAFLAFVSILFVVKERSLFYEMSLKGIKSDILVILLLSFLLAGVLGKTMELGGLIEVLVWGGTVLNIPTWLVPALIFIIVTLIGLATGTSAGTVITTLPILMPLGIEMGADTALVIGAIVGGAMWGDNIAPVSDTTIASALTQESEIAPVVKARLRYAGVAGALALVAYVVAGIVMSRGGDTTAQANVESNPLAFVLVIAPAVLIIMMLRGVDIVYALSFSALLGLVIATVFGLVSPAEVVAKEGVIVTGFGSMMSIFPFVIFLFAIIEMIRHAGIIDWIGQQAMRVSKTARTAEIISALIAMLTYVLTTVHAISVVVSGPVVRSVMKKFNVDRARSANIIDCMVSGLHGVLPHSSGTIIVIGLIANSEFVNDSFQPLSYLPFVFPSIFLLIVFAIAILTGWGRKEDTQTNPALASN